MPSLVILVSAVLVLSCGHAGQTDEITDAAKRLTHVTVVDVSNKTPMTTCSVLLKRLTKITF